MSLEDRKLESKKIKELEEQLRKLKCILNFYPFFLIFFFFSKTLTTQFFFVFCEFL